MTAPYWEDFARARCAPQWQGWIFAVVIALGAGAVIGAVLAMLWL